MQTAVNPQTGERVQWNGSAWVPAGAPSAQPAQGRVITDPYRGAQESRANQDQQFEAERLRIQQESAAIAREEAARRASVAPYDAQRAQADAMKAEAEARAAINEQTNAPDPQLGRIRSELQTDSVLEAVNNARKQIGNGWATGNMAGTSTFRSIPFVGQNSANLNATLEGITGSIINDTLAQLKALSSTGASGFGSLTEREAQRLAAATAALQQTQDSENLTANLARVERHYRNAQALLNGEDPRIPDVAEKYGIVLDSDIENKDEPGQQTALTAEGRSRKDPALAGVNSRVADMIQRGKTPEEIRGYLNRVRPGMGDSVIDLEAAVNYRRQNPTTAPRVDLETVWEPNDPVTQAAGELAMSPLGTAVLGSADTLSFGTADNLTSNPELTRALMQGVSEENPGSYLAGQIAGGVLPSVGLGAGVARLGGSRLAQARAGDIGFGALYGAGSTDEPDDSRVMGALLGGAGGAAGGAIGRGIARTGGRLIAGVNSPSQRALNDAGVRMTPGQILGGSVKSAEDKMTSIPLVGDAINARRAEGIADFNRVAFDEALAPIGASTQGVTGEAGIDIARALRSQGYDDALGGVRVQADPQFTQDMGQVIQQGRALPEPLRGNMEATLPTYVGQMFDNSGTMTGEGYQQALRGLRREISATERLPSGYQFGEVARGAEGVLEGLMQRQAPDVVPGLRAANQANMNVETLRAAVNAAKNQGGTVMPSQLTTAASQTARRFGNNQGTTNQPFYELTRAGQEVLPSRVPDSGTAGRLMIPAAAGAAAGGGRYAAEGEEADTGSSVGTAAIVAALAAAPYSAAGRAAVQRALLAERPDLVERLGEGIYSSDLIASILARPLGANAVIGR